MEGILELFCKVVKGKLEVLDEVKKVKWMEIGKRFGGFNFNSFMKVLGLLFSIFSGIVFIIIIFVIFNFFDELVNGV